jgi:hypothetical protein
VPIGPLSASLDMDAETVVSVCCVEIDVGNEARDDVLGHVLGEKEQLL